MALAVVQDVYAEVPFDEQVTLPGAVTAGNLLVVWATLREQDLDTFTPGPNGFTAHPDGIVSADADSGRLSVREAQAGDGDTFGGFVPGSMVYLAEISGWDSYEFQQSYDDQSSDPIAIDIDMAGEGWAFAGLLWRTPSDLAVESIAPTGDTVELNDAKLGAIQKFHPLSWVAYVPADSDGTWQVTGDPNDTVNGSRPWGAEGLSIYVGGDLPEPPPVDPGFEEPDAGRAILEMYLHDEDATRWGTATWGDNDGVVEGTEGVWSGAGWQDVTPQGVTAHISWGSSQPERGILAMQQAQSWLVTTYDPDRRLDPGNVDSPFYPQLVTGVPIRIRNEATGRVIRTGLVDRLSYDYRAPQYRGQIQASSTIALAFRAKVPEDAVLGDTLDARIRDAHTASSITIGGIPVVSYGSDDYPAIDLSDKPEGERSLWDHIRLAAQEVGWVAYEDEAGTLRVRPYLNPLDRGAVITYENMENLTAEVSEDGQYSAVRVLDPDGTTVHDIEAAPVPRYGKVVYDDREDITTIDPAGFAAAILADRTFPGVLWTPGTFWCFDAEDVRFMAELEILERVTISVPGVLDVSGPLLGMELWVEQRTAERARWLFLPRVATTGEAAIGVSLLLSDDDGSYLLADDEVADTYLEADDE